jgi:hypothetical protein
MGVTVGVASLALGAEQYHAGKTATNKAESERKKAEARLDKDNKEAKRLKAIEDEKATALAAASPTGAGVGSRIASERAILARRGGAGSHAKSRKTGSLG